MKNTITFSHQSISIRYDKNQLIHPKTIDLFSRIHGKVDSVDQYIHDARLFISYAVQSFMWLIEPRPYPQTITIENFCNTISQHNTSPKTKAICDYLLCLTKQH